MVKGLCDIRNKNNGDRTHSTGEGEVCDVSDDLLSHAHER